MADLVVRGMEMPKTCGLCKLCLDDSRICNGYCMFFHRRVNMMERDKNCPLVPLPEGHGRLGDLDALKADIDGFIECMTKAGVVVDGEMLYGKLLDALDNAKTIVPTEGGTDDV